MNWRFGSVLGAALFLLAGCGTTITQIVIPPIPATPAVPACDCAKGETKPAPVTAKFNPAQWADMPAWPGDDLLKAWPAWLQSCTRLAARESWKNICSAANELNPKSVWAVRHFFEKHFAPYRIETSTGAQSGLVTGYYEPLLKGGREFRIGRVPLYAVPDDLLTIDIS